jgi:hypothetical protein
VSHDEYRIATALERIADHLTTPPDPEPLLREERERLLDAITEEAKSWRYRNICFDGMDTVLTPVVSLRRVEHMLAKVFRNDSWSSVVLEARPADPSEKEREDLK